MCWSEVNYLKTRKYVFSELKLFFLKKQEWWIRSLLWWLPMRTPLILMSDIDNPYIYIKAPILIVDKDVVIVCWSRCITLRCFAVTLRKNWRNLTRSINSRIYWNWNFKKSATGSLPAERTKINGLTTEESL